MTELSPTYSRRLPFVGLTLIVILCVGVAYIAGSYVSSGLHGFWPSGAGGRNAARPPRLKTVVAAPTVEPQVFEKVSPEQAVLLNAQIPISRLPNPAAAPFVLASVSPVEHARAQACLAMAVYYEAGNQGPDGEAAVAQVVLNRVRNPIFPKTVCGVVFQGSERSTGCQFTFTCDGSLNRRPSAEGWRDANAVAARALSGYVQKDVGEATHYHTIWVVPYWQTTVVKVAELGAHIFYRWQGALGATAFQGQYAGAETAVPLPSTLANSDLIPKPSSLIAKVVPQVAQARAPIAVVAVLAATHQQDEAPHADLISTNLPANLASQQAPTLFSTDNHPAPRLPMR